MSLPANNQNTTTSPVIQSNQSNQIMTTNPRSQNSANTFSSSSMNQSIQIAPYPPLRERNNFPSTSTLRRNHQAIAPTPLRQSTTAASLGQVDCGRGNIYGSSGASSVQHRKNNSLPSQSDMSAPSLSLRQPGGCGIGHGSSGSASQLFRPATPAPYPATYRPRSQNANIGNQDFGSDSSSKTNQDTGSSSSIHGHTTQKTNSGNHKSTSTPTRIRTGLPTASASPAPTSSQPEKVKRPDVDPRYDSSLTLAQRLEASTDLPLAPFPEYEWKKENEHEYMMSWQPPDRHSEEWRQRDLEGWR